MHIVRKLSPQDYKDYFHRFDQGARAVNLTPADRNYAWRELTADEDFHEWPVPIEHYLTDPYYVGTDVSIKAIVRETLGEFFDPALGRQVIVFIAGIGVGKSFSASMAMLYSIYQLGCMRKPARYLSGFEGAATLSGDSEIVLMNASGAGYKQASKIVFKEAMERIVKSPWFRLHYEPYEGQTELEFPNRVKFSPGTSHWESALGWNVYAFAIDEAAFGIESKNVDYIKELFQQLNLRRRSRFGRGGWGGLFTSPGAEHSFVEAVGSGAWGETLVKRATTWDAKEQLKPGAPVFLLDRDPDRVRVVREGLTYVRPGVCQDEEGRIIRYGPVEDPESAEEAKTPDVVAA